MVEKAETNIFGETKEEIIERVSAELGDAMDCDDGLILEEWAFDIGGI